MAAHHQVRGEGMSDYLDLVAVRLAHGNKNIMLCEAPAWTHLRPGDSVTVRLGDHRPRAIVVDSITTNPKHDEYLFNLKVACVKEPLPRIDSKVEYEAMVYEDEEKKGVDNNG
jgi:hypothetical protein